MIAYKITNTVNNKLYFGITKCDLKKRWAEHKSKSKSGKSHLNVSIRKYGIEKFAIEKLKDFETESEMYDFEISIIKQYKTNNPVFGYNNSIGGEVSSKGKKLSEDTKLKLSIYQKNRIRKPHSQETKNKIGAANKGNKLTEKQKIEVSKRFKNKPPWNKGLKLKDYVKK